MLRIIRKNSCNESYKQLKGSRLDESPDGIDMPKLDTIKTKGVSPEEYVRTIKLAKYRKMFEDKINETPVKEDTVNEIAELVKNKQFTIRVFAAVWCKDTLKALPAVTYITKQIP